MDKAIPVQRLLESDIGFLLSYPVYDEERIRRVSEKIREMGIEFILLRGPHMIDGVPILGKGHTGLVIAARMGEEIVALKIKRVDADRDSLESEADCLRLANSVSVGPKFMSASRDLLAMELVEGDYLVNWIETLDKGSATLLQGVFVELLEKTRRLDEIGLDHGELSKAHRHLIVTENGPRIIDFESASSKRRCSNVTSLGQYLFFNRRMREALRKIMRPPERKKLIEVLSSYKRDQSSKMFRAVLEAAKLVA